MPRSQSDLSNTAIRIFLQNVGSFYDTERGFEPFKPTNRQKQEVHAFFNGCCAYCGKLLNPELSTLDHLIALNRTALGLHAWGNVVSCCRDCNKEKHYKNWLDFLELKAGKKFRVRKQRIDSFVLHYQYNPELGLHTIAQNLYQDVGAVGMTLLRLRFEQAQDVIRAITKTKHLSMAKQ
jgi:hypothetical protein